MTAKEYLLQIRRLDNEIKQKIGELDEFKVVMALPGLPISERVQNSLKTDNIGGIVEKLMEKEAEIDHLTDNLYAIKQRALEMFKVLNKEQFMVMHKYYIEFLPMIDIADILGVSLRSSYNLRSAALDILETRNKI